MKFSMRAAARAFLPRRRGRKILINYANERFRAKQELNSRTGRTIAGFDVVRSFGPDDIDPAFAEANAPILTRERGNGYWLWKPYFIDKVLAEASDGDFVMYVDSGGHFLKPIDGLMALTRNCKHQILLFELEDFHTIAKWTKRDCMIVMGLDGEFNSNAQILASFICIVKNEDSVAFIKAWLDFARDARALTDDPNVCGHPNDPEFKEHRHDQSILSLLARKAGIETIPDISQWGNERDRFRKDIGQVINLVR